ncbi:tuftelin isoform X2 [Ornithorhynchus anatinus]|uniref:Tuftelin 1 n=1 Tax=Ornithorhynchus anatinus TaxID=9258 RepID=F7C8M2_ORNAN|nr:tuftelin isoform X2 [Ornithorhynchus anatinus]
MNGAHGWVAPVDAQPHSALSEWSSAMVSGRLGGGHALASERVQSNDGHEEIIKVYLKGKVREKLVHEKNIDQLKSEVQYIQEARSCLQKLREDISSKLEESPSECTQVEDLGEDTETLRMAARTLLAQLEEAERRHQADRLTFEATLSRYQREAEEGAAALHRAQDGSEGCHLEIRGLRQRLAEMEEERQRLMAKVQEGEQALEELRGHSVQNRAELERATTLEQEVSGLREKIHHLDDMLKSQQRKVRQMIEQLQNSKAVIQTRDATIQELKEKVAYLEAENLEMYERLEHLIEKQAGTTTGSFSMQTRAKIGHPSSIRIAKPPGPKPLPLIRVVET